MSVLKRIGSVFTLRVLLSALAGMISAMGGALVAGNKEVAYGWVLIGAGVLLYILNGVQAEIIQMQKKEIERLRKKQRPVWEKDGQ